MSKTLADELETGADVFGFDAMRGVQAGRGFYIAMCPICLVYTSPRPPDQRR